MPRRRHRGHCCPLAARMPLITRLWRQTRGEASRDARRSPPCILCTAGPPLRLPITIPWTVKGSAEILTSLSTKKGARTHSIYHSAARTPRHTTQHNQRSMVCHAGSPGARRKQGGMPPRARCGRGRSAAAGSAVRQQQAVVVAVIVVAAPRRALHVRAAWSSDVDGLRRHVIRGLGVCRTLAVFLQRKG